jgi:hypothetical protein
MNTVAILVVAAVVLLAVVTMLVKLVRDTTRNANTPAKLTIDTTTSAIFFRNRTVITYEPRSEPPQPPSEIEGAGKGGGGSG